VWAAVAQALQWLNYEMDDRGSIPGRSMILFSLSHRVQTGPGAHLASYEVGNGGSVPEGKAAGAWSRPLTHLHLAPRLKTCGAMPPLPHVFMARYLAKHMDSFAFRVSWLHQPVPYSMWPAPTCEGVNPGTSATSIMTIKTSTQNHS
jgi:hypothetical protein